MANYVSTLSGAAVQAALEAAVRSASAWMHYKGTTVNAILASGNVSSVTDTAGGTFTMNVTNAFVDTYHCATAGRWLAVSIDRGATNHLASTTTTQDITCYEAGSSTDPNELSLTLNGELA